jgi:UDP-N-acetylmuramate dehydrogenase
MEDNFVKEYDIVLNRDLSKLNRYQTGGVAEYFFEPKNQRILIDFLKKNKLSVTVLGGGTNVLIRDNGIRGVVISTKHLNKYYFENGVLVCESGVNNAKIYEIARDKNIGGYEFLGTIPGTVGGACVSNAGCYGGEIKDNLIKIKVCDVCGNIKYLTKDECKFSYRNSCFSKNDIILEIYFRADDIKSREEIENIFKNDIEKRKKDHPYYEKTCGSTFKNCVGTPTWKIIQELGLQNIDFNGCKFSEKHANFLINCGNCKSKDIENLINFTKKKCYEEKNIELELEVKILGE